MKAAWTAVNRNGGRELLADTLTYGLAKGVPGLLGLASVVVFLRLVGAETYGLYALLTAIVSVWVTFSAGWFYQGLLRFGTTLTEPPDAFRRLMRTGLIICAGAFILSCFPHLWLAIGLSAAMAAGLAFGCVALVQTTLLAELQARLRARSVLSVELLRSAACFLFSVGLALLMADGPAALLLGTALGYAVSVAYAWTRRMPPVQPETGGARVAEATSVTLHRIWNFGWPLSLWFAGQLILPLIDRTMMAAQLGLVETGKYAGLSDILTRCFSLAVFPLIQAVYPRLAQLTDQKAHTAVRSLLRRATLLMLAAGSIILPALFLLRHLIVHFALPTPDETYSQLVLPLAAGGFVWHAAMLIHKPLELAHKTRLMLVAMVMAVLIKASANWLLLPTMGPLGAAVATLIAGFCYCFLCLIFSRSSAK